MARFAFPSRFQFPLSLTSPLLVSCLALLMAAGCGSDTAGSSGQPGAAGAAGSSGAGNGGASGGGNSGTSGASGSGPVGDPCLKSPCDQNATCTAVGGIASCKCNPGYAGDGTQCAPTDLCMSADLHDCDTNATCTNEGEGKFSCGCNAGYEGDGKSCTDVDECANSDLNTCHAEATCTNTPGGFTCACKEGYAGDGNLCVDVDECASAVLNECDENATCTNSVGSYSCACNPGFQGDGRTCTGFSKPPITRGGAHSCLLHGDGKVRCWGRNHEGQLGQGNTTDIGDNELPSAIGDINMGEVVRDLASGNEHNCVVTVSGNVKCWGRGPGGALGYGNVANVGDNEVPANAGYVDLGGGKASSVVAGENFSCALMANGTVRCWGSGENGRLGYGNTTNIGDTEPVASAGTVNVGGKVIQLSAAWDHTCALLANGKVRCWGAGNQGQLGYGNTNDIGNNEDPASAGDVDVGGVVQQISVGAYVSCALLVDGSVRCWGVGSGGALGAGNTVSIGDNEPPSAAATIELGGPALWVRAASYGACAGLAEGIRCWGLNLLGANGNGMSESIGDNEKPKDVPFINIGGKVLNLSEGGLWGYCALLEGNKKVRCWGNNQYGQLGYGNKTTIGDDEAAGSGGDIAF